MYHEHDVPKLNRDRARDVPGRMRNTDYWKMNIILREIEKKLVISGIIGNMRECDDKCHNLLTVWISSLVIRHEAPTKSTFGINGYELMRQSDNLRFVVVSRTVTLLNWLKY